MLPSALIWGACSYFFLLQCLIPGVFQKKGICFSWRAFHIISPLLFDPGPPFVDHADHLSSACPISRLPKPSVSCSNQSSTLQGSFPHQCGQNVGCGHLMRKWQFLPELLLHQAPMADPQYLSFFLGCYASMPLVACRSSPP